MTRNALSENVVIQEGFYFITIGGGGPFGPVCNFFHGSSENIYFNGTISTDPSKTIVLAEIGVRFFPL